ncbi:uncharacterized protein LOC129794901 [Lutzomyia longipalpis]|uniref:uncharacterized protein LOC129794901 n=1 Tax=Lutzomyia longipalpis TaxID=7200 RepID=UPI0024839C01|nr:uncharacterized protein LOC129794901 [Lutzomyia longipalpis]
MGAMESSESQSNNHKGASGCSKSSGDVADRIFACPVCYERYDSHIIQCKSGHSVCKKCSERLRQCPQCCAGYIGTRNFTLEDLLTEFQQIDTSPEKALDDIFIAAEARAIEKRAKEAEWAEKMETMKREFNKLVQAFQDMNSRNARALSESSGSDHVDHVVCRLRNCRLTMSVDDLREHLKQRHPEDVEILKATPYLSKSFFSFRLQCVSHRYALVTTFGIFFLIIRVEKQPIGGNEFHIAVTAWIQGTCKDEEAHLFYSRIQIQINNIRAIYHDCVHGCRPTVADIEGKNECLKFSRTFNSSYNLIVDGYVCLNKFSNNPRQRRTITETYNVTNLYDPYSFSFR